MSFGDILKEVRLKNGDSLRSLGYKLDVAFSYIDNIEKGKRPISKELFEKIISCYPFDKDKLIKAYCDEMLPNSIKESFSNANKDEKKDLLLDIFLLMKNFDIDTKKNIMNSIVKELEYITLKQGKYEKAEKIFEEIKDKIKKL